MRISFLSNSPWTPSGYGQQLKIVIPRLLAAGHELAIQAFHGHSGSPINWNGVMIYGNVAHPFGQDVMSAHASNFKSDILISNMDAWVIDPEMMFNTKWVAWFPVDSDPCPPLVAEKVKKAFHRIIWTEFAKRKMDEIGITDYDYIPYGVDTKMFYPMDKTQCRTTAKMPTDKFIVGMVAMNKGYPPRKAFFQNIQAFKNFHDKHPDSLLYLHTVDGTRPNGEAINLMAFIKAIGLEPSKDVIFADQYSYVLGYPDDAMNILYNCFDVHLLVSMGEGFGMPQVEAQACGVPVICGDWTTMPELFFSGWKVDKKDAVPFYTLQNSYQFLPRVEAIQEKLEMAYRMQGNEDYIKRARDGVMKYDIDKVVDKYWKPVLAKIEQKIKEAPIGNLEENLAVLR